MTDENKGPHALLSSQAVLARLPGYHYRAIGQFVVSFSRLELMMDDAIMTILNFTTTDSRIMTRKLEAGNKEALLRSLAKSRLPAIEYEKEKHIFDKIVDLIRYRNFIVHGVWTRDEISLEPLANSLKPNAPPGEWIGEVFEYDKMQKLIANSEYLGRHLADMTNILFC